ncbi:hypothetical protein I5W35_06705 [Stenotrophomonas maltophilia]|uniref:hypothetical protein n=1 Tax=Stenotrophomonas sp. PS02298 TaxID=2991424 RepID=UPI0018D439FA|nr:hypothetical protein [Stenotrophomonas sp. PS02298]MBH1826813.1 hypothetical protein [Stenotrophomonas maltophilia]
MLRISANSNLLRVSLFALLALASLVRPMLNLVGDLHSTEHAVVAAAEHGHHHPGDHHSDSDREHAKGSHALLHSADANGAVSLWNNSHWAPSVAPETSVPALDVHWRPSQQPSSPFRPPIV